MAQTVTWHRFRPRLRGRLDDATLYEEASVYLKAREIMELALREASRRGSALTRNEQAVHYLKQHLTNQPEYLLATTILLAPAAAEAQRQMDKHQGGYKNREKRLFELIDFNDSFVDTVLALDKTTLETFTVRFRTEVDAYCERCGVSPFDDKQFDAIVHGLSREIAVYRAAEQLGYRVKMTSRVQDSMGIDMIITDPASKKSLNIDVKTHSSFHFRLLDLEHQRRIDEQKRLDCELAGYCTIRNGNNRHSVETMLLRIATDRLGPIRHYEFVDTTEFAKLLHSAIEHQGRYLF
ncbi:MAG TPA: hypothetical protein VL362_00650 [Patescibacteria group bacterium]|jgi:hypothetical protein|nr:hypothetical protein [Patescibacteria group bacterium]